MFIRMPRKPSKSATPNPTGSTRLDPRVHDLARSIERIMEERGLNKNQLSIRSGVDPAHLGKYYRGEVGLSVDQTLNVLQALGAAWAIRADEPTNPRLVPLVGSVSHGGKVTFLGGGYSMPAAFQVDASIGPFAPGDRVIVEPGSWEHDKWVLVRHVGGDVRLHRCELRGDLRLLVMAESIVFEESQHVIAGVVTGQLIRR